MKIRFLNNSVRFRMSTDEMQVLSSGKEITSITHFLTNPFVVFAKVKDSENHIDLQNNKLTLTLQKEQFAHLHAHDQEVGLSFEQGEIKVLFEKDFKCLTDRGEDESQLFENPRSSH